MNEQAGQPLNVAVGASAYKPSGVTGNTTTLLAYGSVGAIAGLAATAGVTIVAVLLNLLHNVLPDFVFVLPLLILGCLALAPAVAGLVIASIVSKAVVAAKCRSAAAAGGVALLCTSLAIAWAIGAAVFSTPPGESFLDDRLLPFVRLMVGGCINFTAGAAPEPVNVPAWIIYGVLGGSALLGALASAGLVSEAVCNNPYCERCQSYLGHVNLWSVAPERADFAAEALAALDIDTLRQVPRCLNPDDRVDVDHWSCGCGASHFVDLMRCVIETNEKTGVRKEKDPVRLISVAVTAEQADAIGKCEMGSALPSMPVAA